MTSYHQDSTTGEFSLSLLSLSLAEKLTGEREFYRASRQCTNKSLSCTGIYSRGKIIETRRRQVTHTSATRRETHATELQHCFPPPLLLTARALLTRIVSH